MADEEEQDCCPLCMEELDITDKTFDACPCGYQVCLWCWHQIKNEYNGLCPACRTPYSEISKQKNTLDREDVVRRTKQRKQKEKTDRRNAAAAAQSTARQTVNRKSLANVRVMQRNLVYVIGLPQSFTDEEHLRSTECFGQYGKIVKAVVNKTHLSTDRSNATASAYITFANKDDALACIIAIDGFYLDGSMLRASFGTTKYCNFFLRNLVCNNPDCLYLHELGDQDDSFTKEEMQSALHSGKAAFRESTMAGTAPEVRAGLEFPPPYRPQASAAASSAEHADAQRKAQSAAAIYKLKQSAHRSDSSSSVASSPSPSRAGPSSSSAPTISEPFSKIVAGAASVSRTHSSELTMAEKLTSDRRGRSASPPASPPSPTPAVSTAPVPSAKVDESTRRPTLHVDTSSGRRPPTGSRSAEDASVVVGPLEALKLATGSTIQEPAWAQPFPSPSVALQPAELEDAHAGFSPFTLGFDGGIHRSTSGVSHERDHAWGVASAFSENDPLGTHSSVGSASVFATPPPLPMAATSASASSSLSFASIDAIFSQRSESASASASGAVASPSDALAGLLGGVQLSSNTVNPPPPPPLATTPQSNARSSRFAFANQPSGLSIPASSPGAPSPHHASSSSVPSSPFGMLESSGRRGAPPSPFGYGAAVSGLGSSSSSGGPGAFPLHSDTSAFPPLGSHQLPPPQHHHAPPPFSSSGFGAGAPSAPPSSAASDDVMMMGSGLAFLQQMLPNVNISFGGDYPTSSAGFPDLAHSTGGGTTGPSSAWHSSNGSLSSLGFDDATRSSSSSGAPGFYDPAIVSHSSGLQSASFFSGLSGASSESESERAHHLHSALGGAVYRHPGSILNNGN